MVWEYISFFLYDLLPNMFLFLDSLMIVDGVSLLQLGIVVILLGVVVGAILLRV